MISKTKKSKVDGKFPINLTNEIVDYSYKFYKWDKTEHGFEIGKLIGILGEFNADKEKLISSLMSKSFNAGINWAVENSVTKDDLKEIFSSNVQKDTKEKNYVG